MLLRSRLAHPSYARRGSGLSGESDSRSKAETPAPAELTGSAHESDFALEAPSLQSPTREPCDRRELVLAPVRVREAEKPRFAGVSESSQAHQSTVQAKQRLNLAGTFARRRGKALLDRLSERATLLLPV